MSYNTEDCGRCDSTIVQDHARQRPREQQFYRRKDDNSTEAEAIKLCSECLDDVWVFVFDEEVDRSDKVDPMSLGRVSENVERHMDELQGLLEELESVNDDGVVIGE